MALSHGICCSGLDWDNPLTTGQKRRLTQASPSGGNDQLLGLTERAAINREYEEMLARLCKIKEVWCLPKPKGQ